MYQYANELNYKIENKLWLPKRKGGGEGWTGGLGLAHAHYCIWNG